MGRLHGFQPAERCYLYLNPEGSMIHYIFLLIKYQLRPLPTDPAELRELAMDLQVPDRYEVESALLQKSIHQKLKFFSDALYIAFLSSPLFAAIVLLAILFVWISNGMPP